MAVPSPMIIIVWWVLLQAVTGQEPFLALRYSLFQFGRCEGPSYLEQSAHLLGSLSTAGTEGAVANHLRTEARTLNRDNEFYTDSLPQVQILLVKQTCTSSYAYVTGNHTFAALIKYTCRGVACRQRAHEIRTLEYLHLFSFVCLRKAAPGLYTQLPITSQYVIYVDRNPPNTLVNTITAPFGSCELCRVLPSNLQDEYYNPASYIAISCS